MAYFLHPTIFVFLYSILVLIVINLFSKFFVNQSTAKAIKDNIKELQKKSTEERKAGNNEKSNQLMKDMMSENSKLMKMNMKPLLFSMGFVLVFLAILSSVYVQQYDLGKQSMIDGVPVIAEKTDSMIRLTAGNETVQFNQSSQARMEIAGIERVIAVKNQGGFLSQPGEKLSIETVVVKTPVPLPYFGDKFGWLGWYIICSIPLTIVLRKLMKIHL